VAKATAGGALDPAMMDADYLKAEAEQVAVGERCMISAGHRGVVSYVGKVPDLGVGYFVGVSLDEPFGNCNGKLLGVSYFEC
jgi:tubulin-specific chaperone B